MFPTAANSKNDLVANHTFSRHAVEQMDVRIIRRETVECVLAHHDRRVRVGAGALALSLSHRQLEWLRGDGLPGAPCWNAPPR